MAGEQEPGDKRRVIKAITLVSTISTQFAASVVIGFLAGRYADRMWGTDPWLMLVGLLLGLLSGFYSIYYVVTSFEKEDNSRQGEVKKPDL